MPRVPSGCLPEAIWDGNKSTHLYIASGDAGVRDDDATFDLCLLIPQSYCMLLGNWLLAILINYIFRAVSEPSLIAAKMLRLLAQSPIE